ncbi:cellulase family glycosylhydrolase [Glaciihabitans sp. dw_435]|uniref:cellulase family glycosylhydrolase n=1 Tax=Glaciihabitans sp. dw_435 TaxID=2720081 RepID=UPI001BD6111C|nr:cellulase family glycosylhydrolase [Glaciihabitans sp. dw_435]
MKSVRIARVIAAVAASILVCATFTAVVPAPSASAAAPATSGWLHTDGSAIRTSAGKTYIIKAVAWFGMETSNCAPHGLWQIGLDAGLTTIKSMGFNTIRLPFSNECLAATSTNSIDFSLNPTLKGKKPLQVMDIFIAKAKAKGLNVILDRHRPDSGAQSALWYTAQWSEARWIGDWKSLAKRYKSQSNVIGFDLHNEPHGTACWGCGNAKTDWRAAANRAGNAVLAVNPNVLIIIEGVENQSTGSTWWGGGLADVLAKPVKLAVSKRVVYSPHDYPSSIYAQKWFSAANYPKNLPGVWDKNWGLIAKKKVAPILLGEFGSKLETTSDKQWMSTLVTYLKTTGMSYAYWSFNPNSGDTGGLLKDDWTSLQTAKLAALKPLLGTTKPVPVGSTKPVAVPATPAPPNTPSTTAPVTPAPSTTTQPTPGASSGKSAGTVAVAVTWTPQSWWNAGYVVGLQVSSSTGAAGWSVTWPDPNVTSVVNAWGMRCSVKVRTSITCSGDGWAAAMTPGASNQVGLQVASSRAPSAPKLTVAAR